jgi:hypothetical protein
MGRVPSAQSSQTMRDIPSHVLGLVIGMIPRTPGVGHVSWRLGRDRRGGITLQQQLPQTFPGEPLRRRRRRLNPADLAVRRRFVPCTLLPPSAETRDLVGHGLVPLPPFAKEGSMVDTRCPKRSPEHALGPSRGSGRFIRRSPSPRRSTHPNLPGQRAYAERWAGARE